MPWSAAKAMIGFQILRKRGQFSSTVFGPVAADESVHIGQSKFLRSDNHFLKVIHGFFGDLRAGIQGLG